LIPVIHTNELWRTNLLSIYREIPVHRLLIGNGGCADESIAIAQAFPRVIVFDHTQFSTLGYSIRKLIEAVETDWFVYLHSDVYLPVGWFHDMKAYQSRYEWIECSPRLTILVDFPIDHRNVDRAFSGAQMGSKRAFEQVLEVIDDDYLYRNEDIIIAELIKEAGFRYARVYDVYHYHQEMHRPSPWLRKTKSVKLEFEVSREEEIRTHMMQVKGIVKYLKPRSVMAVGGYGYQSGLRRLRELGELDWEEYRQWIRDTNPDWLPFHRSLLLQDRLRNFFSAGREFCVAFYHLLFGW